MEGGTFAANEYRINLSVMLVAAFGVVFIWKQMALMVYRLVGKVIDK